MSLLSLLIPVNHNQGPTGGAALLVKRRNSKWSFTNEPEVRFKFKV